MLWGTLSNARRQANQRYQKWAVAEAISSSHCGGWATLDLVDVWHECAVIIAISYCELLVRLGAKKCVNGRPTLSLISYSNGLPQLKF